jgi:hypothetical protein
MGEAMRSDPFTSSAPPQGRWRRLVRALSRPRGPKGSLDERGCAGITHRAVVAISPSEGRRLHICAECGADVVNPAHAETLDEQYWTMLLRCGACGATVRGVVSNEAAQCYDRELNRGYGQIARALKLIEREDMEEWAGTFAAALGRDLIAAEDFARPHR